MVRLYTVLGLGNTLLWPVYLVNEKSKLSIQKNLESYRKKLENIPEDKIISVAPEIGVPIAEKLSYVSDESISNLYVNLLAKASSAEHVHNAHPSFVNVINNLSPDEAKILEKFRKDPFVPGVRPKWIRNSGHHRVAIDCVLEDEMTNGVDYVQNLTAYLSNLVGLGLIEISIGSFEHKADNYRILLLKAEAQVEPVVDYKIVSEKLTLTLTDFGRLFITACHD